MTETSTAVQAHGLVKPFGDQRAVDGVDLASPRAVYGVLGPNGAGKTTTMRMLATLLRSTAARPASSATTWPAKPHRVRQLIGVTGQYASVDEDLSGEREPLALRPPARLARRDARATARRTARGVRARGRRRTAAQEFLRRHASTARPRGEPDHASAADLPRRADHGPRPAHPRPDVGHRSAAWSPTAARCCSPRSTSTRPISWPTGSRSSTAAEGRARARPTSSRPRSATRRCSCSSPPDADQALASRHRPRPRRRARDHAGVRPPQRAADRSPTAADLLIALREAARGDRLDERRQADPRRGLPHHHRPRRRAATTSPTTDRRAHPGGGPMSTATRITPRPRRSGRAHATAHEPRRDRRQTLSWPGAR